MNYSQEQLNGWMEEALLLAGEAALVDEVPIGALLIHDGKVLASGRNRREETHRAAAHAEIVALEEYSRKSGQWRLPENTTLIVTVEPCLMCTGALLWARAFHIHFGCRDTKNAGLLRIAPLIESGVYDHKFRSITEGTFQDRCSTTMSNYFKGKR